MRLTAFFILAAVGRFAPVPGTPAVYSFPMLTLVMIFCVHHPTVFELREARTAWAFFPLTPLGLFPMRSRHAGFSAHAAWASNLF